MIKRIMREGGFLNTGRKEECEIVLYKLITGFENSITAVNYQPSLQMVICGDKKGTCYWRSVSSGCLVAVVSMSSLLQPILGETIKSLHFLQVHLLSDGNTILFGQYKLHHKLHYIILKLRYGSVLAHRVFAEETLLPMISIHENKSCVLLCHEKGFYNCSLNDFSVFMNDL